MARFTLLDLMHLVHTFALLTVPFSSATLTVWMLAFHFLLVWRLEWDTVLPETWPLPQISHFLDIFCTSFLHPGDVYFVSWACKQEGTGNRYISNSNIISQQIPDVKYFFQKVHIFFFGIVRGIITTRYRVWSVPSDTTIATIPQTMIKNQV